MKELTYELTRVMEAIASKIMFPIYVIDVEDIPDGMSAEEFAEEWKESFTKGELIYISR